MRKVLRFTIHGLRFIFFKEGKLADYWYESGSPTLLISQMLADPDRFDLDALPIDAYRHQLMYTGSRSEISLKALMFQTGYLTIDSYESSTGVYKLKFPNQEVAKAFEQTIQDTLERRVKDYFISTQDQIKSALQAKDIKSFIIAINIAFANVPYYITSKTEKDYHSNLHMLLYGLNCLDGIHIASESSSSKGRADMVLTVGSIVYIIEIVRPESFLPYCLKGDELNCSQQSMNQHLIKPDVLPSEPTYRCELGN